MTLYDLGKRDNCLSRCEQSGVKKSVSKTVRKIPLESGFGLSCLSPLSYIRFSSIVQLDSSFLVVDINHPMYRAQRFLTVCSSHNRDEDESSPRIALNESNDFSTINHEKFVSVIRVKDL